MGVELGVSGLLDIAGNVFYMLAGYFLDKPRRYLVVVLVKYPSIFCVANMECLHGSGHAYVA